MKINTNGAKAPAKEVPVKEAPAKEVPVKEAADKKKVHDFLLSCGEKGAQASDIAIHLGFITKETDVKSPDYKAACKKVRKLARDVVDSDPNGKRDVRDGRQKIYQLLA